MVKKILFIFIFTHLFYVSAALEEFKYTVQLGSISIGSASITTENYSDTLYKISCMVKTSPLVSIFFPFEAHTVSFCSKNDFSSVRYYENAWLKKKRYQFVVNFLPSLVAEVYKFKKEATVQKHPVTKDLDLDPSLRPVLRFVCKNVKEHITDPLSVLHRYRLQCSPADSTVEVFLDFENYSLPVLFKGKEKITTYAGKFHCIKVCPKISLKAILPENSDIFFYFSDDKNRIPLMIKYDIPFFGSGRASLSSYSMNTDIFQENR